MPALNPEILEWARRTAGLSLDDAAREIDLKEAHGASGAVCPTAQMSVFEDAETECKSFWKGKACPLGVFTTLKIEPEG
jgi:hypothetical protein